MGRGFTSVSAYCNAGFDILGFNGPFVNLIPYAKDPLVSLTVAFLIIIGGIGFLVVSDIHICYLRKKREGERHPRLTLHSKIVLWMTGILLAVGTILFFVMEYGGVLRGMNFFEKLNVSFFQSAAARTAGFATVDIASMHDITKLMSVILMFIGASPSSTAAASRRPPSSCSPPPCGACCAAMRTPWFSSGGSRSGDLQVARHRGRRLTAGSPDHHGDPAGGGGRASAPSTPCMKRPPPLARWGFPRA